METQIIHQLFNHLFSKIASDTLDELHVHM
jgi:hypothetical protein